MQTATFRLTTRLSALAISAGALAILLAASDAGSTDREAVVDPQSQYLEGLMIRHDVRYAIELPTEPRNCDGVRQERG